MMATEKMGIYNYCQHKILCLTKKKHLPDTDKKVKIFSLKTIMMYAC